MDDETDATADAYEAQARAAILADLEDGEDVSEFLALHRAEVPAEYWVEHFGATAPSDEAVLAGLEMGWALTDEDDEDQWQSVDFSLPADASDHVLVVRFNKDGTARDVAMES